MTIPHAEQVELRARWLTLARRRSAFLGAGMVAMLGLITSDDSREPLWIALCLTLGVAWFATLWMSERIVGVFQKAREGREG